MPVKGNSFTAILKKTHLNWGTYRRTYSRAKIGDEGYIPIPSKYAVTYTITNKDNPRQSNVYKFSTSDGFYNDEELKASGNRKKGNIHAKNFHGNGNLKLLGKWFRHINAIVGDEIKVEFVSPTEILLTKL